MLLTIDVGNSEVTVGVFDGEQRVGAWRLRTDERRTADEYGALLQTMMGAADLSLDRIDGAVLASVVPRVGEVFLQVAASYFDVEPLVVGPQTPTRIRLDVDLPAQVGADRIVNAVAAYERFGAPSVVVDFGTATTFDVVASGGRYIGGVILPGVQVAMEALFQRAALLSRIDPYPPKSIIGRNTEDCLRAGYYFGFRGQMEWVIQRIAQELGEKPFVVATGGLAPAIARFSSLVDQIDPYLTLDGLRRIYAGLRNDQEKESADGVPPRPD